MKRIINILVLATMLSVVFVCNANANTINIPADYSTIQAGINAANNGDVVLVQPGTYVENINYNEKSITVASLFLTTQDTSYISQTIIDGDSLDSVVKFESGEDTTSVICGFKITNGQGAPYPNYTGGGITCNNSSPRLENVTISGNSFSSRGGGICCREYSSPSLENVTISDNSAGNGGGIYCDVNSSPSLVNVTITDNSAPGGGGGIFCDENSSPILEKVTITGNSASYGGGINCSNDTSPSLKSVIISGNSASDDGGGIYCHYSSPSLVNVTISGNSASDDGGGICCWYSSPSLDNTIVSDNTGNYGIYVNSGNPIIIYSNFWNNEYGNYYGCSPGTGCIEENPLFVDPLHGDYHLSWANYPIHDETMSPCIDAGDPTSPLDPDGTIADMGAFYYAQGLHANFEVDETYGYLQATINFKDLSIPRDSIISWYWDFGDGIDTTYTSYIDTITHLYQNVGTYNVSLTVTDINDSTDTELKVDYITIYEGNDVNGHAYLNNQTNNAGIKVIFERFAPSIYNDFTYTNAGGYYDIGLPDGIYNITYFKENYYSQMLNEPIYSNITIQEITLYTYILIPLCYTTIQEGINNCIEGDSVIVDTGTYVENINFNGKNITVASLFLTTQDNSYISQTVIDGDSLDSVVKFESGEDSTAILCGFTITNGASSGFGAGIYCRDYSSPSLVNLTIIGNSAYSGSGGGICCDNSSPSLDNVTIISNSAYRGGGVYCNNSSSPSLVNVTISGNSAGDIGGGIYFRDNSSPILKNVIISNNTGNYGIYNSQSNQGNPTIIYSDIYDNENGNFYGCGQWVGVNVTTNANGDSCDAYYNIQEDPLFLDTANGDYHLTGNSPCIDAGDPTSPLDPDGTIADMGAFYYEQALSVYPTDLDFGNVLIGSDSTLSIKLINYSDSVITIYDIFCSDTVFTSNWTEPTIPGGDSLVIEVTFTPHTIGIKTGTLTIENSYIDKNVTLSGNGLGAFIVPDLYSLNFGAIEPGYPDTLLLEITNDGNINLTIQNIIDAPTNYFNFISITDSTILPDETATLYIEFDPQVEGLFNDTLFVVSNAYNEDILAINLSGEGGLTPAPVENLIINVDSVNVYLSWDSVTTTIHGNSLEVDCYIVYHESLPYTVFKFLGYTTNTNHVHNGVAHFSDDMFYQVTAYVGDMPTLQKILAEYLDIKLGELDRLVNSKKNFFRIRR